MKHYKRNAGWIVGSILLLGCGIQANAVHIDLQGGACQLPLQNTTEEGAAAELQSVTEFGLLGTKGEDLLVIGLNDGIGYIDKDTFSGIFPTFELPELPEAANAAIYQEGSNSEEVMKLQQALIKLNYLEGTADGGFGPMTAEAVRAFKTANHLEENGVADPVTFWLALDQAGDCEQERISSGSGEYTPKEKFSAIYDRTTADLEPYMESGWKFSYDPFEEVGFIDPGITLADIEEGNSDLDRVHISVSLKVMCTLDYMTEEFLVQPVLQIDHLGAYRPYIKGAQISVGNEAAYLTEVQAVSQLEGIQVRETAYITLDATALSFLKNKEVKKAMLRLQRQDSSIDIELDLSGIWCRDQLPDDSVSDTEDYEDYEDYDSWLYDEKGY